MTTTTTEQTWLHVMPAIPLERGCPMVFEDAQGRGYGVVVTGDPEVDPHGDPEDGPWIQWEAFGPHWDDSVRVDLDASVGFGYALRWYIPQRIELNGAEDEKLWVARLHAWACGATIFDADRDALARAIAEAVAP